MGRGLFGGIVWGIVVTGLVLVVLALVGPPPDRPGATPAPALTERPAAPPAPDPLPSEVPQQAEAPSPTGAVAATDIELPPGSEFNRAPDERAVSLPDAEVEAPGAPVVRAPDAGPEIAEAPLPDTAPAAAPAPVTTGPDGLAPPLSAEAPPDMAAEDPVPAPPSRAGPGTVRSGAAGRPAEPQAPAPAPADQAAAGAGAAAPSESPAAETAADGASGSDPAAPARIVVVEAPTPDAPSEATPAPAAAGDRAGSDRDGLPRIRPLPGAEDGSATAAEETAGGADASETGGMSAPTGVRIGRLPTIGTPTPDEDDGAAAPQDTPAGAAGSPAEPELAADGPPPELGALARNAVAFAPDPDRPLFSVILIDVGSDGLAREALTTFSFPVTFAVDPTRPDAAQAIEAYREAGYEVVLLASGLPEGAAPSDLEVTLAARAAQLDDAVAVMDLAEGGFQDDRDLTAQMVAFAGETGHGLVTHDRGFNSAARLAEQAGVPQATVFRMLDSGRPNAPAVGRMLDRAVFRARQDGHVVLVGHSYPDTVTALYSWALEAESEEVALAPVSAVLRLP